MTPLDVYNTAIQEPECDMLDHMQYLFDTSRGNVLEIGVRTGNSTSALVLGCHVRGIHVYSVDVSWICEKVFGSVRPPRWTFICADSRKPEEILPKIPPKIDVLFIDADHHYEAVKSDLANYAPLVKENGCIILHDVINPEWPGVRRAFDEFVEETKRKYIIMSGSYGLGVIYGTKDKYSPKFRPDHFEKV